MNASAAIVEPSQQSDSDNPARFQRILLASEGRTIPDHAITRTVELASAEGATVRVFSIARVHGVAFGFPSPGLLPTKSEWKVQRDSVTRAVRQLRRHGIEADGQVVGTRKSTKRILQEAAAQGSEAIVMAADADRNRLTGDLLWSQEPQRVRRRAKVPVYLARDAADS